MGRPKIFEDSAQRNRELSAIRQREATKNIRELGEIPKCSDPELRESLRYNLKKFAEVCFPHLFTSDFGPVQLEILSSLENALLHGENSILCVPRGYGKSSLTMAAILWAALFGHRKYQLLIGASAKAGERLIKNIKSELWFTPILGPEITPDLEEIPESGGLFPETLYAIRKIGHMTSRCAGQTYKGQPTRNSLIKRRNFV